MRPIRRCLPVLVFVTALVAPGPLAGQGGCELLASRDFRSIEAGGGNRITYVARPTFGCAGGVRIRADSAEVYSATSFARFIGRVVFNDSINELRADLAHYFTQQGRLQAWHRVQVTAKASGTVITGDTLLLLRANEVRDADQMTVTGGRPHATVRFQGPPSEDSAAVVAAGGTSGSPGVPPAPGDAAALPETSEGPVGDSVPPAVVDPAPTPPSDTARARAAPGQVVTARGQVVDLPPGREAPARGVAPVIRTDSTPAPAEAVAARPLQERPAATPPAGAVAATPSPPDTAQRPWEVDADRIYLEGESYFEATGTVEIVRDSLRAFADSVHFRQGEGDLLLRSGARIEGSNYTLTGRTIAMALGVDLRRVSAREDAVLVGEDVRLTASEVRIFLTEGRLERLVAVAHTAAEAGDGPRAAAGRSEGRAAGPGRGAPGRGAATARAPAAEAAAGAETAPEAAPRPEAVAQDFILRGDSIEILAPGEILQTVFAAGSARGESTARDSLNTPDTPELAHRDWLTGDTIVASFVPTSDPAAAGSGGSRRYELERMVARGRATSLYRLEPSDSTVAGGDEPRLAIHYVKGAEITIVMKAGEVETMEVVGQTEGIHLEPRPGRPASSTAAPPPPGPDPTGPAPGREEGASRPSSSGSTVGREGGR